MGGARDTIDPIDVDFGIYDLFAEQNKVGHYEYELREDIYNCQLDLNGLLVNNYKNLRDIIEKEFPDIASQL